MGKYTLVKHLVNSTNQARGRDPSPKEYCSKASGELEDIYSNTQKNCGLQEKE
jgi:hypothetical protein